MPGNPPKVTTWATDDGHFTRTIKCHIPGGLYFQISGVVSEFSRHVIRWKIMPFGYTQHPRQLKIPYIPNSPRLNFKTKGPFRIAVIRHCPGIKPPQGIGYDLVQEPMPRFKLHLKEIVATWHFAVGAIFYRPFRGFHGYNALQDLPRFRIIPPELQCRPNHTFEINLHSNQPALFGCKRLDILRRATQTAAQTKCTKHKKIAKPHKIPPTCKIVSPYIVPACDTIPFPRRPGFACRVRR